MEDLTGKQLGPYQIVAPLGEGGMAAVYKAYHPAMERYVALKILPRDFASKPEFVARFKQEAKVVAGLQHPHILPVFDFGEAEGYTYLVMPFIKSGTLTDLLKGEPLPLEQARSLISQIGGALDYAHARGLVHRDVKPSNVLIDESGNCLLSDFGLAKILEASEKLTMSGAVMGTPAYMSPEQGLGRTLDGRTDVYSLGVILYEMATGRTPYKAETPMAVMLKHISAPLPPPSSVQPGLPESVEAVILKALAKEPEDRYQTAGAMVKALQAAGAGAGSATQPVMAKATLPGTPAAEKTTLGEATRQVKTPKQQATVLTGPPRGRGASPILLGGLALVGVLVVGLIVGAVALSRMAIGAVPAPTPVATAKPEITPVLIPTKPQPTNPPPPTDIPTADIPATSAAIVPEKVGKLCLLADNNIDDRSFNERAWRGLQDIAGKYGAPAEHQVAFSGDEKTRAMESFLKSDCGLIIAVGFTYGDTVKAAAQANPDRKFVILDFAYDSPIANVWQQIYATDQSAFLAGYLAASVTKTGKVATFGGMDIPPVVDFMNGFALGVDYYNQKNGAKVELLGWDVKTQNGEFAGDFGSPGTGQKIAESLIAQGADIIFPVAGPTGYGAGDAALAHKGVYVIGVDTDWAASLPEYAGVTLTSVVKRLDVSVVSAVQAYAEGKFEGQVFVASLANGETGLAPFHALDSLVPPQVEADLEQLTRDIIDGRIKTKP